MKMENQLQAARRIYNGDVTLYITDRRDPIVMAYNKAYPELFADLDNEPIPEDIEKHLVYPKFFLFL